MSSSYSLGDLQANRKRIGQSQRFSRHTLSQRLTRNIFKHQIHPVPGLLNNVIYDADIRMTQGG
jgi:hypothetical protein